jgi:hypothetical protein
MNAARSAAARKALASKGHRSHLPHLGTEHRVCRLPQLDLLGDAGVLCTGGLCETDHGSDRKGEENGSSTLDHGALLKW